MKTIPTLCLVGVLLTLLLPATQAQSASAESEEQTKLRRVGVAVGVGNTFGWFGAAGEFFLLGERASVVVGAGYTPKELEAGGAAFALAARWYHGHRAHRFFLEGSFSDLTRTTWYDAELRESMVSHNYGPGVTVGLQYTAGFGLSILVGGGAGWDPENSDIVMIMNLGVGYTLRR